MQEAEVNHFNELLKQIGLGNIMSLLVAQRLRNDTALKPNFRHILGTVLSELCYAVALFTAIRLLRMSTGAVMIHMENCANVRGQQQELVNNAMAAGL